MRALDFWLFGIWAAVMGMAAFGPLGTFFSALSYLCVVLALIASFRQFQRDHAAQLDAEFAALGDSKE